MISTRLLEGWRLRRARRQLAWQRAVYWVMVGLLLLGVIGFGLILPLARPDPILPLILMAKLALASSGTRQLFIISGQLKGLKLGLTAEVIPAPPADCHDQSCLLPI